MLGTLLKPTTKNKKKGITSFSKGFTAETEVMGNMVVVKNE